MNRQQAKSRPNLPIEVPFSLDHIEGHPTPLFTINIAITINSERVP